MASVDLADSEWILMQCLWKKGECTVREILAEVEASTGWTRHTVISYLNRMIGKGAVAETEGRPKRYRATMEKEETLRRETQDLLGRVYGGDPFLMATNAVRAGKMTPEETQALMALLEKEL